MRLELLTTELSPLLILGCTVEGLGWPGEGSVEKGLSLRYCKDVEYTVHVKFRFS